MQVSSLEDRLAKAEAVAEAAPPLRMSNALHINMFIHIFLGQHRFMHLFSFHVHEWMFTSLFVFF